MLITRAVLGAKGGKWDVERKGNYHATECTRDFFSEHAQWRLCHTGRRRLAHELHTL